MVNHVLETVVIKIKTDHGDILKKQENIAYADYGETLEKLMR